MKKNKTLSLEEKDIKRWEKFCETNFRTKRVLSKIMTEAMEQYIKNYYHVVPDE